MLHIQSFPWRARERTMGWFALLVISMALAVLAARITQWFGEQSANSGIAVMSPSGAPGFATSSHQYLPMALTIPFAMARAQQDVVARLRRQHSAPPARHQSAAQRRNLTGLNGARRLIAGLAVAQALGSSH